MMTALHTSDVSRTHWSLSLRPGEAKPWDSGVADVAMKVTPAHRRRAYPVWGLNPRPVAHKTVVLTTELELTGLMRFAVWG